MNKPIVETLEQKRAAHTLEQQRAAHAWKCCQPTCQPAYQNLAKGLPALIMNSGLMQVLVFLHEKGNKDTHHKLLGEHLRNWLHERFKQNLPSAQFDLFMNGLMEAPPHTFQMITTEAFAWLRWLRQMAPAASHGEK
ncbi:MAG: type III-B CRISPR module-associated protein Cmr5 [Burkholderiales bacterium]|jgi:CRISPR-associated protein Cmr5